MIRILLSGVGWKMGWMAGCRGMIGGWIQGRVCRAVTNGGVQGWVCMGVMDGGMQG